MMKIKKEFIAIMPTDNDSKIEDNNKSCVARIEN